MQPLIWERRPDGLRAPALVCAFKGWNDAGDAASAALQFVGASLKATRFATIDPEEFFDFQAARPRVALTEGRTREITWPEVEVFAARVPRYVAAAPNPKAALALVRKLESLVGVSVDAAELESAATDYERQVSLAVQSDPDVQAFVERLEQAAAGEEPDPDPGELPSGDVLAREFQRFLRQRGPGDG